MSEPRKYVMTKVAVGDYLLPGNDGRSIFRLTRMDPPREGWSLWRLHGALHPALLLDPADWASWELVASELLSRGEAEREAVRLSGSSTAKGHERGDGDG